MAKVFRGQCLCGAVRYEARGRPVVVAQCHCEECRKISGTGHSIGAMYAKSDVRLSGQVHEYKYMSARGSEVTKASCPICASPIYGCNTLSEDHMTLTLGSMDDARDLAIDVVIFERDRPEWDQLGEGVMCFHTQPDWSPDS